MNYALIKVLEVTSSEQLPKPDNLLVVHPPFGGIVETIVTETLEYHAKKFKVGLPTCEVCVSTSLMCTLKSLIPQRMFLHDCLCISVTCCQGDDRDNCEGYQKIFLMMKKRPQHH